MEFLFFLGLSIVVIGLLSIWEGFVLTKLWAWFVVPTFGLPVLTIPIAIGLALLVGLLAHQMRNDSGETTSEATVKLFAYGFVNSGIVLALGWVVTLFL